jgi:hypothetical protein
MKVETLAEQLLFATLRIEATQSVGTGFIVQHEWGKGRKGPFLVTNKHVVHGAERGNLRFTIADQTAEVNRPSIGRSTNITLAGRAWQWVGHPSEDIDVAVLPLAGLLNHLDEKGEKPYYRSIPTSVIPGQETVEDFDAVEEVLFVGYPSGIYDKVNNLPIARRGTTATHPSIDYNGMDLFLIDASVFQGSSGSPVLIYDNGAWKRRDGRLMSGQRTYLLGILGQAYFREEDGAITFQEIPTAVSPVVKTNQMIDLGVVYKARTIVETIEHLLGLSGELPMDVPEPTGNP